MNAYWATVITTPIQITLTKAILVGKFSGMGS